MGTLKIYNIYIIIRCKNNDEEAYVFHYYRATLCVARYL